MCLGVKENRPLADFALTQMIAAKNLATKMDNFNVEHNDLYGEPSAYSKQYECRSMLDAQGIRPEELPLAEGIKKSEYSERARTKDNKSRQYPNFQYFKETSAVIIQTLMRN